MSKIKSAVTVADISSGVSVSVGVVSVKERRVAEDVSVKFPSSDGMYSRSVGGRSLAAAKADMIKL